MGNIDWIQIEDMPEEMKDGRRLILWVDDVVDEGWPIIGWWIPEEGYWGNNWDTDTGGMQQPTHFAEVNPPDQILRGSEQ